MEHQKNWTEIEEEVDILYDESDREIIRILSQYLSQNRQK